MPVKSADEFYSIMGVITREMLEFGLMDANCLIKVNYLFQTSFYSMQHPMTRFTDDWWLINYYFGPVFRF